MSSSSPPRSSNRQELRSDILSSSSGIFVGSGHQNGINSSSRGATRRSDIHSDAFSSTPNRRRRMFVDANGMPVHDEEPQSDATFSNVNPDTSEAEALGGGSTRVIWGTNISIQDSMSAFKNFLYNFTRKYRLWADGATEEDTRAMGEHAEEKEYLTMLDDMRKLGVTGLNLDARNLKAYPSTLKLWHQLYAYPQEIIPLMDQTVKDVMVELAVKETQAQRNQVHRNHGRARDSSSAPPIPSSDADNDAGRAPVADLPDLVDEVQNKTYKVLPFGLDKTVNMRELDPSGKFQGLSLISKSY